MKSEISELRAVLSTFKGQVKTAGVLSMAIGLLGFTSTVYMLQVYDRVVNSRSLMTLAMLRLWRHGARSRMGRLYYTAVVFAGWGVCIALLRTGLFGW